MYGDPQKDFTMSTMSAPGEYNANVATDTAHLRSGMLVEQTLKTYVKPSMGNINNIAAIQVQSQYPTPNATPLARIRSNYTFLPQK